MTIHLEREIDQLKRKILAVGAMVEEAITCATTALTKNDVDLARSVVARDEEIDRAEVEVEEECLKILALHQPVAIDLRFVVAVLKMNNDLERMADLATNIAERCIAIAKVSDVRHPPKIHEMTTQAQDMVNRSLDALVNSDIDLARQVCGDDDKLDQLQVECIAWIFGEIRLNPERVEPLISLFSATRHLERIGDMATNICEDVIYMLEGTIVRHQSIGDS